MRKFLVLSAVLSTACLATSSASANDVFGELETPANNQVVSGKGTISGWAFVAGEDTEIKLRIDGVTQRDINVLCCTRRTDVDATVPGAPDNTGFGFTDNFSNLSPGPHLIGVDIRSDDAFEDFFDDRDRKVIDHTVIVVRPGNTNSLNSVNLSGASCSIAGDALQVNNVQLNSAGGTSVANLEIGYAPSEQAFILESSSDSSLVTRFVAHLNGSQEVPLIKTGATGEASFTLNPDNSLTCSLITENTNNATAAQLHFGPAGQAGGPLVFAIPGGPTTWACPSTMLTTDQVNALRLGQMYVVVLTNDHSNGDGEIRGQLVAQ